MNRSYHEEEASESEESDESDEIDSSSESHIDEVMDEENWATNQPSLLRQGSDGLPQKSLRQSQGLAQYGAFPSDSPPERQIRKGKAEVAQESSTPQDREVNERFRDVRTTGQWGSLSKKEMFIGAIIVLLIIGGVVAAIVIFTGSKGSQSQPQASISSPTHTPSSAPSFQPEVEASAQYEAILSALEVANVSTKYFPVNYSYFTPDLVTMADRAQSTRAMAWILTSDPRDCSPEDPWLVFRFALASIYFAFTGTNWTNAQNWLSGAHACNWYGVVCDRLGTESVLELNLADNNLIGTIPDQISLLSDIRSLVFSGNHLSGTIPAERIGNLQDLSILSLDGNTLTGDLEDLEPLNAHNILGTLMIQQNNITGQWPRTFCPRTGEDPIFFHFALDCDPNVTRCLCCTEDNCF